MVNPIVVYYDGSYLMLNSVDLPFRPFRPSVRQIEPDWANWKKSLLTTITTIVLLRVPSPVML